MKKSLRPYQQDALDKLRLRLKETTHPLLINASVGAGKSLIIANLLLILEKANWRALCLTMNAELIRQNANTYNNQGGKSGIFCAALNSKEHSQNVIFASPHSVVNGIKSKHPIESVPFNLIVVDEAHNISPNDNKTMYMRVLNNYGYLAQLNGHKYRIVGLTGTPYRGKGISIVGDDAFFKEQVCDISTSWLIEQDFLVNPIFGAHKEQSIDFSKLRLKNNGKFNTKELDEVINHNERLTAQIMREIVTLTQSRNGVFIFASTKKHCKECLNALPKEQSAIITGDTTQSERIRILDAARQGKIKYLININVLTVGVDVPLFDTVVFVRPTESLVLYTQAIGRGLRLHPQKQDCLILDYAGNLERHGDIDNPIINAAIQPKKQDDPEYCIPCLDCNTSNKVTARRCIGMHDKKRCEHYFVWKECEHCLTVNDLVSRQCRGCDKELIDPNKKLTYEAAEIKQHMFHVKQSKYWLLKGRDGFPTFHAKYETIENETIYESFLTRDHKNINIFYGRFIKPHVENSSDYYQNLSKQETLKELLLSNKIKTPNQILCVMKNNRFYIKKRIFNTLVQEEYK